MHEHFAEQVMPYALGLLDARQQQEIAQHLVYCTECRALLHDIDQLADVAALASEPVAPSLTLREDILHAAKATPQHGRRDGEVTASEHAPQRKTPRARHGELQLGQRGRGEQRVKGGQRGRGGRSALRVFVPALVAACVALIVVGFIQRDRISDLQNPGRKSSSPAHVNMFASATAVPVSTGGKFAVAHGQLLRLDGHALLVLAHVPPPPPGRVWQAWKVGAGHAMQNIEQIDHGGSTMFVPVGKLAVQSGVAVVLTLEPPGMTHPTGPTIARVTI